MESIAEVLYPHGLMAGFVKAEECGKGK